MEFVEVIFNTAYAVGEILVSSWPGRLVLGAVISSVILRWARA
jgi:hypothetical protein